jgi:DNA-binding SARP family transcriptional activator
VLALLARGGPDGVSRDNVINTLWPDTDEGVRVTFNQTLYALRRYLERDEIIVGVRELRLDTELLAIDVAEFQDAVAAHDLERAIDLYDGSFLDGFHLPSNDEFERWVERERLAEPNVRETLEQLARDATARHDHARDALVAQASCARSARRARRDRAHAVARRGRRPESAPFSARVYEILIAEELSLPADRDVVRLAEELRREQIAAVAAPAAGRGTRDGVRTGDDGFRASTRQCLERRRNRSRPRIAAPPAQTSDVVVRPARAAEWRIRRRAAFSRLHRSQRPRCSAPPWFGTMARCLTHHRHRSPPTSTGLRQVARSAM